MNRIRALEITLGTSRTVSNSLNHEGTRPMIINVLAHLLLLGENKIMCRAVSSLHEFLLSSLTNNNAFNTYEYGTVQLILGEQRYSPPTTHFSEISAVGQARGKSDGHSEGSKAARDE